jgi:dTDP-D-glucose 4,6-dehydratase
MYQNILITGGAGFIGSNLALKLQKDYPNSKILILDDFSSANFKI